MADEHPHPTYVIPPENRPTLPAVTATTTTTTTTSTTTTNPSKPTNTTSGQIVPTDSPKTTTDGEIVNPSPTSTPNDVNPSATTTITAGGSGGGVTLLPGIVTSIRGTVSLKPTPSLPAESGNSYTLVSSSVSGVVLAFAFMGVLVIGLVADVIIVKYTHLGRRKEQKNTHGELTEQLRNPADTNDLLDRKEKNIQTAANQADFLPAWYRNQNGLHPQSVPDQAYYQDWATPSGSSGSPLVSSTLRQPRVINLPPTQLPPDVEIDGPKGEWSNTYINVATTSSSSPNGSASDLNEFERWRPQIHVERQGEDSLFDTGDQSHNPHVINSINNSNVIS